MRIGLDYRCGLHGRGGIAVYARELVRALARQGADALHLYAHQWRGRHVRTPDDGPPLPADVRVHRGRMPFRLLKMLARLGRGADRWMGGVDVLHLPDYTWLPSTRAPVVVTLHDVLFTSLPACYTAGMREGLTRFTAHAVAEAAALIVPSQATADALQEGFGADPARTYIVPHGVPALPEGGKADVPGPFVFAPGTLEPRKNHMRLLAAFQRVRQRHPSLHLVLAGSRGWMDEALVQEIEAQEAVHWLGAVPRTRLAALYREARAVAYPSLGEGFGLPPLEALAVGAPTLVGAGTACEEVVGDAALAVDPRDEEALAAGLERLLTDEDLRADLARAGPSRAQGYTWARSAQGTRQVYAQVAS